MGAGPTWNNAEQAHLRELCGQGITYAEIAKKMGRSHASVQLMAGRNGLSNGVALGGPRGKRIGSISPHAARCLDYGNAAELIVCADLILAGHRAFQSSQGLPFDVVADIEGRLIRIGVKGVLQPVKRPSREGSRICYQFSLCRSGRNKTNPAGRYTSADFELCAMVALDIRRVIYLANRGGFYPTSFHVDPPSSVRAAKSRGGIARKHWDYFPLASAIEQLNEGKHE